MAHTRHIITYCNNTLPRGGVYCKIRSLRQFASLGSRDSLQFQFIPTRGSVLSFFFPERECIGNYPSNSRGRLAVYKFNTLPLYKKNEIYMYTIHSSKVMFCKSPVMFSAVSFRVDKSLRFPGLVSEKFKVIHLPLVKGLG